MFLLVESVERVPGSRKLQVNTREYDLAGVSRYYSYLIISTSYHEKVYQSSIFLISWGLLAV